MDKKFSEYSNEELLTLLTMCEKEMEYIGVERRMKSTDDGFMKNYDVASSIRSKIYIEINDRIHSLNESLKKVD